MTEETVQTRAAVPDIEEAMRDVVDPELKSIDVKGLDPREFVRRTLDEPKPSAGSAPASGAETRATANGAGTPPNPTPSATAWDQDAT